MSGKGFWRGLRDILVSLVWLVVALALGVLVAAPVVLGLDALFLRLGLTAASPDMARFTSIILGLLVGVVVVIWLDRRLRRRLGYSPLEAWDFLRWIP